MLLLNKIQKSFANQMKFLALSYARQANKEMYLSAMAYNLKKYLKFISKTVESNAGVLLAFVKAIKQAITTQTKPMGPYYLSRMFYPKKTMAP